MVKSMLGVYKNSGAAMMPRKLSRGAPSALGRNIIITGASGGIGRVVARRFLADGDTVRVVSGEKQP